MHLPAYTLLDAAVSYSREKFSVRFNIYNLANIKYANNGSFYPDLNEWLFDVGDPVNFRIQANIRL